jgi:hypothetical protein
MAEQPSAAASDSDSMADAATDAFWGLREQLQRRDDECHSLRQECAALTRGHDAAETGARAALLGAVKARNCALGLLQASEDRPA